MEHHHVLGKSTSSLAMASSSQTVDITRPGIIIQRWWIPRGVNAVCDLEFNLTHSPGVFMGHWRLGGASEGLFL
jgi:hypothetical protein